MSKQKTKRLITLGKKLLESTAIAGAIIVFVGLYYILGKAGIPYQDPPLQLQIQYYTFIDVGETLLAVGFTTSLLCLFVLAILKRIEKHKRVSG
ncbi:MAG: hypothetical protein K5837_01600 [Candidatus Saccharibacteria bacterium]|nr:hypothetical protein [Candidatus Saccharibacteria bacterium]